MIALKKEHYEYFQLRPWAVFVYSPPPLGVQKKPSADYLAIIDDECQRNIYNASQPDPDPDQEKKGKPISYTGEFTRYSRKNFTKAVDNLWGMAKARHLWNPISNRWSYFRISHLTLTISGRNPNMTNKDISKHCLKDFLNLMRNRHGMSLYVWKAELQENLNIHYHILSNLFLPMNKVQNAWNKIQDRYGLLAPFEEKFNRTDAPSTRIDTVRDWQEIAEYLKKYAAKKAERERLARMPKEERDRFVIGKVYDCSEILMKTKYPTEMAGNDLMDWLNESLERKTLVREEKDFYTAFYPAKKDRKLDYPLQIRRFIKSHYLNALTDGNTN